MFLYSPRKYLPFIQPEGRLHKNKRAHLKVMEKLAPSKTCAPANKRLQPERVQASQLQTSASEVHVTGNVSTQCFRFGNILFRFLPMKQPRHNSVCSSIYEYPFSPFVFFVTAASASSLSIR